MKQKKGLRSTPFTLWLIPGFLISVTALALSAVIAAVVPWGIFSSGRPGPPEPLDLPLVSSTVGWFVLIFTVGFTGLGIWLDRGRQKRIDPLARIALGLSVLGFAEGISGAVAMSIGEFWPVNLIDVSIWILLSAAVVGAISWVRILLSKGALRGWIFATCAVGCSAGYAWIVFTFLASSFGPPLPDDGIELPIVTCSFLDQPDPLELRAVLHVSADGPEELSGIPEIAARMKTKTYTPPDGPAVEIPDEPLLIRADARASWASVRQVIARAGEAGIWKIQIASRWEDPPVETKLCFYLPKQVGGDIPGEEAPPPPFHLEMLGAGRFSLDGEEVATLDELADRLWQYWANSDEQGRILSIQPMESTPWQEVLDLLSAATLRCHFNIIELGSLNVMVQCGG